MLFTSVIMLAVWGLSPESPCPAWGTDKTRAVFDDNYTDKNVVLTGIDLWIRQIEDEVVVKTIALRNPDGFEPEPDKRNPDLMIFTVFMHDALSEIENNRRYYMQVRVTDSDGDTSDWSEPLYFYKAWVEMPVPGMKGLFR